MGEWILQPVEHLAEASRQAQRPGGFARASNILLDYAHPSSTADSAGAVWLNEIIAKNGFPDAFKPSKKPE